MSSVFFIVKTKIITDNCKFRFINRNVMFVINKALPLLISFIEPNEKGFINI